jgi:hypothetical protein
MMNHRSPCSSAVYRQGRHGWRRVHRDLNRQARPMSGCENFLYRVKPAAYGGGSVTCGRPAAVLGAFGGILDA